MNPNNQGFWSNYIQNGGNSPFIPNQQNNSYFGSTSHNQNPHHNPKFLNSPFIPIPQNNIPFGNYPYHTSPY